MASIDIKRFLSNFGQNYKQQMFSAKGSVNVNLSTQSAQLAQSKAPEFSQSTSQNVAQNTNQISQNFQLNALQGMDRAVYAKEVLQFPRNLNEFIFMVQKGMTQAQFNQLFANQLAAQRNNISQLQAQILAQLQGLNPSMAKEMVNIQLASQIQPALKKLEILSNGMINLNDMALLLQKNGKEGLTKLIMSMTEVSKSGITDLSQMKEMAKLINASISIASENNPQKTLKLLLMLYLPWLPLEDCVGFDLEIQQKSENAEISDSILTVTISTINFGIVKATLFLETSNSVQVSIECSKDFPKQELKLRVENEQKYYAMESIVSFNTNDNIKEQQKAAQNANINMSQTTEINPYLLLMAHTIIKQVIDIDNNKTMGVVSHSDEF
ncbi:MAG: hypothetical protein E7Z87_00745 [Cyanobacteria bacterium SIG26]|nr:hypothetical protein [Cyanobacteria bacterium SIG26]